MSRSRFAPLLRRAGLSVTLAALALHTTPATACPRCLGASSSNSLLAYLATGAALSLLPMAIIGTIGFIIYRQSKRNNPVDPHQKD